MASPPEMSTARGYLGVRAAAATPIHALAVGARTCVDAAHGEAFNYAASTWREVASMSRPRIWLPPRAWANERSRWVDTTARYLDLVEAFAPGRPTRNRVRSPPRVVTKCTPSPRGGAPWASPRARGRCAVGGFAAPHYLATVEAYDPRANQWWGCAPLAAPRRDLGLAAVEHRNTLVCAGGYDGNAYLGVVEGFDPRTNNWRALAPLRRPRQLLGLCAKGDSVFALGGFDG